MTKRVRTDVIYKSSAELAWLLLCERNGEPAGGSPNNKYLFDADVSSVALACAFACLGRAARAQLLGNAAADTAALSADL